MIQKYFAFNKGFILWSVLAGITISGFGLGSQVSLWIERGGDWKGIYTIIDYDEPFYAAYVQSLVDGKPRRNNPYSGAADNTETPQKESYLSIQFLASYPTVLLAKVFGLSISNTMILLTAIIGFVSAFVLFWLFYLFSQNAPLSFVGTIAVLFFGAIAAGQGGILASISPSSVQYPNSLLFLRRSVPAMSFPALFLFFGFTWKFLVVKAPSVKIGFGIAALLCFAFTVYSYFYHWTTAIAWFGGLIILWAIFRVEDLRRNKNYYLGFSFGLIVVFIPYFVLLSNRSSDTDSALLLNFTHQPDLWRVTSIISYATIAIFFAARKFEWLDWREPKNLFLLSFALTAPIVFNQQVLTGRSLQPFHYELFCVNYMALFSLLTTVFILLKRKIDIQTFNKFLLLLGAAAIFVGYFDTVYGTESFRVYNIWRDELLPVAQRIKTISQNSEYQSKKQTSVVLSFDFTGGVWMNSIDLPTLSSQTILWSPHISMFPDVGSRESLVRFHTFIYYQNLDKEWFETELRRNNDILTLGALGFGRSSDFMTGELNPVTSEEIDKAVKQYEEFRHNFSFEDAQSPTLSFVLIHRGVKNDLSSVDRWYERDDGEDVGEYTLYRVKLRGRQN